MLGILAYSQEQPGTMTKNEYKSRIMSDPKIMMGKPVIRGTRITVEIILRHLGSGDSIEQVLKDYPQLERQDILAAQSFAADYLAGEMIIAA